jgi:GrpB-like predicted nucleotidyltransferase (UPF0157 family)
MPERTTLRAVQLLDYDPEWPRSFQKIKGRIWPSVREVAVAIEHVGSTSIPGMIAKPVIDVDVVIASPSDLHLLISRLGTLGYLHRGNLGVEDRDAFRAPEGDPPQHLYVCLQNTLALRNHLAVRDYLRTHPSEAVAYSTLKRRLVGQFPSDKERYQQGKTDLILSILRQSGFASAELNAIERTNRPDARSEQEPPSSRNA